MGQVLPFHWMPKSEITFSFKGASTPDPWPGALPLEPAGGSAPTPVIGLCYCTRHVPESSHFSLCPDANGCTTVLWHLLQLSVAISCSRICNIYQTDIYWWRHWVDGRIWYVEVYQIGWIRWTKYKFTENIEKNKTSEITVNYNAFAQMVRSKTFRTGQVN